MVGIKLTPFQDAAGYHLRFNGFIAEFFLSIIKGQINHPLPGEAIT